VSLRPEQERLAGWGNFPIEECAVYRPENRAELEALVVEAEAPHWIPRGLGRAYGDASLNAGSGVVLAKGLDRVLDFYEETGLLWCESGLSLAAIIERFLPHGFFFPVTPGTKYITLGGAIAANVHGKNHHSDGSISAWLEDFRLLLATGEVLDCSRERNAEVFWATLGGMGLTGYVLDVRLRLKRVENAYVAVDYEKARDLDAVLDSFLLHDRDHVYSVAWIDTLASGASLGRSVIMRANHALPEDLPRRARTAPLDVRTRGSLSMPFRLPNGTLNPFTIRVFNQVFYASHRDGRFVTDCNQFFYPLDRVRHWNRGYGSRGVIQYQALIPRESGRRGMVEILETLAAANWPSFLSVLKPFGEADAGLLSFPRPGLTISLDLPAPGADLLGVVNQLDQIVLRHGGSVYLAKDSCLRPDALPAMYPELDRFRSLKAKIDPAGRISSSLARRVGILAS